MKTKTKEKIILGIDPGSNKTGYGIIKVIGSKPQMMAIGVIDLSKFDDHYLKLKHIFDRVTGIIDEYKPDELAIEAPFYGKNVQSMLKLGRAQGAAISAALSRSLPIFEYAPRKIKMSITGQGAASKEQVAAMLENMLNFQDQGIILDATDGLAAALCHFFQSNKPSGHKTYNSWKDFMNKNPQRIK
ncbi:MAG TPA: crossover junction endodeoxyribonuclease RuvC [Bacteroidales bacterium]|nr:crossover junction endodeoxyribonuclease RuvC [Bacteroidales bacterium]OQB63293.1 MAG: Crossover junction endodeoxyribonuclease RuvC [Bacteroidetes bacterium ADurb.Bin145]NMD04013.1 crossover junction endodeoxyribonuclease RuvC [Bacteroidales bacterium]HOU01175.1 crossover junction endodeoxyribonuclease RuvC [Bacteroidales bacterium]HQG62954.1 crossover junction endodeoxyribonuclease RuvC [Bacteroidales bacterium]